MRCFPYIYILLLAGFAAQGQVAYMKDGRVFKGDDFYCAYKETGTRINSLSLGKLNNISDPLAYPEACNDEFKDFSFGNQYLSFINATARVFASSQQLFIVYYYNIKFEGINAELNLRYHPMLIRSLVKDMVKYDVINGNFLNEKNAVKLIEKWSKKESVIKDEHLQTGIINNYNSSDGNMAERKNTINICIKGNKIFRDDSLVALYKTDMHLPIAGLPGTNKNDKLYMITDTGNNLLAWVRVPKLRSVFFLQPAGEKESLCVVTTDRDEQKIIASATKVLMVHQGAKQEKSDKPLSY